MWPFKPGSNSGTTFASCFPAQGPACLIRTDDSTRTHFTPKRLSGVTCAPFPRARSGKSIQARRRHTTFLQGHIFRRKFMDPFAKASGVISPFRGWDWFLILSKADLFCDTGIVSVALFEHDTWALCIASETVNTPFGCPECHLQWKSRTNRYIREKDSSSREDLVLFTQSLWFPLLQGTLPEECDPTWETFPLIFKLIKLAGSFWRFHSRHAVLWNWEKKDSRFLLPLNLLI